VDERLADLSSLQNSPNGLCSWRTFIRDAERCVSALAARYFDASDAAGVVAMVVTNTALLSAGWLYAKIVLVLILTGIHGYFVALGKKIDAGVDAGAKNGPTNRQMRLLNEVPFVLMIGIVILVVIRPF